VRGVNLDSAEQDNDNDNNTVCPGDAARAFKREAEIWRQLMHDNVHPFLGVWVNTGDVYLVSPFMERGDAAEWVRTRNDVDRLKVVSQFRACEANPTDLTVALHSSYWRSRGG
jgi:serine/threonine protein kinase